MTSRDAGATSSSINSPTAPSPMPTLSPAPSLTLSPVSTTSGNLIHRPFPGDLLSDFELFMALRDLIEANSIPHVGIVNCGRVLDSIKRMISPGVTRKGQQ